MSHFLCCFFTSEIVQLTASEVVKADLKAHDTIHDEQKPHVQIFNLLALKLWSCFAHKWTDRRYLMWSIIFSDF